MPPLTHPALAIALLLGATLQAPAGPPPRPNILLVMADDLGYADVGFNGHPTVHTPNLDRLAASGLVFDRFYSASPVCSPTRGSCLTGRHPGRYGITNANTGHLPRAETTIPETLAPHGYTAGHFGKWHLGTLTETVRDSNRGGPRGAGHFSPPRHHGFTNSFATEAKVPTYDPMFKPGDAPRTAWDAISDPADAQPYGTAYWHHDGSRAHAGLDGDDSRIIVNHTIAFVKQAAAKGTPFFATVWFHAPHLPVVASPQDATRYPGADQYTRNYLGCITALDREVGRLWHCLEQLGAAHNTLLFFSSDNGPEGQADTAPGSAYPLRGRKRDLYEGGIRVPAFAVWPAAITPGQRTTTPAITHDYLPTAVELATGAPPPANHPLDGTSLAPLLTTGTPPARPAPLFFRYGRRLAAIDGTTKLVSTDHGRSFELYDLATDPAESVDVSHQHPTTTSHLINQLTTWTNSLTHTSQ